MDTTALKNFGERVRKLRKEKRILRLQFTKGEKILLLICLIFALIELFFVTGISTDLAEAIGMIMGAALRWFLYLGIP